MPERTAPHDQAGIEDHDRGLAFDVGTLVRRRAVLGLLGGVGLAAAAACAAAGSTTSTASSAAAPTGSSAATAGGTTASGDAVGEVPTETAGPYPGDGSNGPNVLDDAGIVRADITGSFGSSTTKAGGIPLTVRLTVTDKSTGAPVAGAAVYLWHCNREGGYSLYSPGLAGENYLRGIQPTDAGGTATFATIFPGCYSGRWPHIHFEVYRSLAAAVGAGGAVKTSQIALPEAACAAVYATDGYAASVRNLAAVTLATDNVFGNDRGVKQLATMSGSATGGYAADLRVGV